MPSWQAVLGDQGINNMTAYVLGLSGHEASKGDPQAGGVAFKAMCAACHGADAEGNQAVGAPNLTDSVWLYKNPEWTLEESVQHTLRNGRNGHMPAQAKYIGEDKVHLVAAYVYSLSQDKQ